MYNQQGGTNLNQVVANYPSQSGDSGAPVFSAPDVNNNVSFYGLHTGVICFNGTGSSCIGGSINPVYSPWEGIQADLSLMNQCFPPTSGNWTITTPCMQTVSGTPQANVRVQNNSVLTIQSGVTLNINFTQYNLLVDSGSGVLINPNGTIP